jgi:hypothetical protein
VRADVSVQVTVIVNPRDRCGVSTSGSVARFQERVGDLTAVVTQFEELVLLSREGGFDSSWFVTQVDPFRSEMRERLPRSQERLPRSRERLPDLGERRPHIEERRPIIPERGCETGERCALIVP